MSSVDPRSEDERASTAEMAWRGIERCRQGDWREGLYWLGQAADARDASQELPSLFFAYLGFGMARYQGQTQQGLLLCRHALELELYQPESYYFLARAHLLAGDRRAAFDVVERGLQIDPTHEQLLKLRDQLGRRRPPVLPFLQRRHPLNRVLGRLRHHWHQRRRPSAG
ncbi:MAG: hypothetical protein D6696_06075 [Acidobacteria bacterium]|nr:MAG: hypothetical protein D6696_06075 [Acidobacteriota bacterium]